MAQRPEQGHRRVPHTADIRIEAWAPSREACLAEAVTAVVDSFADTAEAEPTGTVELPITPAADPDLLVGVLDEVVFQLDTEGRLPLHTEIQPNAEGGLTVRWQMASTETVELVGAVPKAVSLHELRFDRDDDGWSCAVTLDV